MKKKKIDPIKTKVFIVCDLSGSMEGAREVKQRLMVTEYIKTLETVEADGTQEYEVTLLKFSGIVRRSPTFSTARSVAGSEIAGLTCHSDGMGHSTALRDAIGLALDLSAGPDPALIQVFTDGDENASFAWSTDRLAAAIKRAEGTGNVTIAMAGPSSAISYLQRIGVPPGNFRAWDGSVQEMAKLSSDTVSALQTYSKGRAVGTRSSNRFYADPNNLTTGGVRGYTKKVDPAEIKVVTKLMDGRSIADFYGGKFKAGNHFYQLIKPEYIQEDKELVVHIKSDNEYRVGSRSVRTLLGLPEVGKIRVHPGPHSDKFDLFVQSSSVNRKLVEGQKMLSLE